MIGYDTEMKALAIKQIEQTGHFMDQLTLDDKILSASLASDFNYIDQEFQKLTAKDGELFKYLSQFTEFKSIEFIISLRESHNEWEEDGIWHDDGSRIFAFSLSLTIDSHKVQGGELHIRKKNSKDSSIIAPFEFGKILLFQTGTNGYEHKIHRVLSGKRLIIAGWCS